VALLVVAVVAAVGVTVAAVVLTGNRTVRALLSRMLLLLVSALAHAIMPRLRLERACFGDAHRLLRTSMHWSLRRRSPKRARLAVRSTPLPLLPRGRRPCPQHLCRPLTIETCGQAVLLSKGGPCDPVSHTGVPKHPKECAARVAAEEAKMTTGPRAVRQANRAKIQRELDLERRRLIAKGPGEPTKRSGKGPMPEPSPPSGLPPAESAKAEIMASAQNDMLRLAENGAADEGDDTVVDHMDGSPDHMPPMGQARMGQARMGQARMGQAPVRSARKSRQHKLPSFIHPRRPEKKGTQQMLWENYFPGYQAIRARYQRIKVLLNARSKRMGMKQVVDGQELHSKTMANPYIFCKKSFPPNGYYDQAEFHSCLEALSVPKLDLQNVGDSNVATDLSSSPAGWHQPDGPGSLSPGSDGWSRW